MTPIPREISRLFVRLRKVRREERVIERRLMSWFKNRDQQKRGSKK